VDDYAEWLTRWGMRTTEYSDWLVPSTTADAYYNTSDIANVVQEVVDRSDWGSGDKLTIFLAGSDVYGGYKQLNSPTDNIAAKRPRLFVEYHTVTASWYPLPPLSLAELPITLDVVALVALIAATAYTLQSRRKKQ